jgi:hypothetical protein
MRKIIWRCWVAVCLTVSMTIATVSGLGIISIFASTREPHEVRQIVTIAVAASGTAIGAVAIWSVVRLSNRRHAKRPPDAP